MPGMAVSAATTLSRRSWKTAQRWAMKSCGPARASAAAAWLMEEGLEVDCDCSLVMALISAAGPAP